MAKTALVTGCSSGIGRATANGFLDEDWAVYATARNPDELGDLADRGCRTAALDVTDQAEVAAVVESGREERGHLDCLVNNAGYGQFGAVEDVPMDRVVEQFEVNTFGPLRLVHAVLPGMRERGDGTIVNVTAGAGSLTLLGIGIYNASKYAFEAWTRALRQETAGVGVDVVAVQPGLVATEFYDRALEEIDSLDRTPAYDDLYRALGGMGAVQAGGPGINQPERVAETIRRAAEANRPDATYRVGPVATLGSYAGRLGRGQVRDAASQFGLRVASSDLLQRALRRRSDAE